jgi:hypothetical protein
MKIELFGKNIANLGRLRLKIEGLCADVPN